ncbi:MAG: prenyltransferase [Acidimicrobiia bacterium]|nr:prenyltransferase [Acidimicrobiia bacterium]
MRARAFLRLTRPVFLLGGGLLYALGAALSEGPIEWVDYALGQALVTSVQLTAQYANEYFDIEPDRLAGKHRTWLTGGSGVLPTGQLPPATALRAAIVTSGIALGLAAAVAPISGGASIVGLLALLGSWLYSTPPVRLVSTGWGVAAASTIVAALTPLTGALIQGSVPVDRFVAVAVPLWLIHNAMLIAFERPDLTGDTAAGKRTLSVRLGPRQSARLHTAFLSVSLAALVLATIPGPLNWDEAGWAFALVPLGVLQAWWFSRASDPVLTTSALATFGGSALALLGGLV